MKKNEPRRRLAVLRLGARQRVVGLAAALLIAALLRAAGSMLVGIPS